MTTGQPASTGAAIESRVLDRKTLRFADPGVEERYQVEAVESIRRESRIGSGVSVGLWITAGVLIPTATSVSPAVSTPIVLLMAGMNLLALVPIRRMRTLDDALRLLLALNTSSPQSVS